MPENLFVTYQKQITYASGTGSGDINSLFDSRHYTKYTTPVTKVTIDNIDGAERITSNAVILWADNDDPDAVITLKDSAGETIQTFTGIDRRCNLYQYTLEEDTSKLTIELTTSKTVVLRHLWNGRLYAVKQPEYYDPSSEEIISKIISNRLGNVIYRDYQANQFKLDIRFNNLSATDQTAFEQLRLNAYQQGRAFWYFHGATDGRLYKFDSEQFMLAYQKGELKSCALTATSITREIEDLTATAPASQPTSLVFNGIGNNQITLSWTVANCYPDGYLVIRSTSDEYSDHDPVLNSKYIVGQTFSDGSVVAYFGSESLFTDTGLEAGTEYFYKIFSYNEKKRSWCYNTTSPLMGDKSTTGGSALGVPNLLTPATNYVTADLTTTFDWSDVPSATSYRIQIATDSGFSSIVETGTPAASTYTSSGLDAGQTYYWRARAEAGASYGDYASAWIIKTLGTVTLDTPADASFTSDTTPTFAWNAASNASGYIFELATTNAFGASIIETYTGANTTFTATTVATDGWLYWRVRPTAEAGVEVGSNTATRSLELFVFRDCLDYDGSNDYSTIPDANAFRLNEGAGGKPMSWSIWLNPDTLGSARWGFFHKGDMSSAEREYQLIYQTSTTYRVMFSIFGAADASVSIGRMCTNGDLATGSAQHIVVTYNGNSTIKIYINSVQKDVANINAGVWAAPYSADGLLSVGRAYFQSGTRYYDGKQDEFAIWSKELSQAEIDSLYNSGNGRSASLVAAANLVGYWKNNEGAGGTVNDEISTNDMTLAGAPSTPSWTTW